MNHLSTALDREKLTETCNDRYRYACAWLMASFLAACGGGGDGPRPATPTVADTTPDAFSFVDQVDVVPDTQVESGAIVVSGINASATVSVTGGEYAINGGAFTDANGTISNGQSVVVRLTAPSQLLTTADAVLTVGGVSDTFSATTLDDTTAPHAAIQFPPAQSRTESDSVRLHGTASDDYSDITVVEVNGVTADSVDGFATWSVELPLSPGSNTLDVRTVDTHGNSNPSAAQATILSEVLFAAPTAVALDPNLDRAFVLDHDKNALLSVDLATGERFVLSDNTTPNANNAFVKPTAVAFSPGVDRVLVMDEVSIRNSVLLSVHPTTGERTVISDNATPNANFPFGKPVAMTLGFNPGRALVVDAGTMAVLSVDLGTGARSVFSDDSVPNGDNAFDEPVAIALDEVNDRALVVDKGLSAIIAVDPLSRERTVLSDNTNMSVDNLFEDPTAIVVDQANNRALVTDNERLIAVDLTTGNRSPFSENQPGDPSFLGSPSAIALDVANDRAIVVDSGVRAAFSVDLASGERTILADNSTPSRASSFDSISAIAVVESGNTALLAIRTPIQPSQTTGPLGSILSMDLATGERSILSDAAVPDSNNLLRVPTGISVDAANNRALVVDVGQTTVLNVELTSGSRTVFSSNTTPNTDSPMSGPIAIALDDASSRALLIDGAGNILPVTSSASQGVLALDLADGARSVFSSNPTHNGDPFDDPSAIAVDSANGHALVADRALNAVFNVNLATGDRVVLSDSVTHPSADAFDTPSGIAVDSANNRAFVLDEGLEAVVAVNLTSGSRSIISDNSTPNGDNPLSFDETARSLFPSSAAIAFDSENNRILVTGALGVYAVSPVDGQRVILSR